MATYKDLRYFTGSTVGTAATGASQVLLKKVTASSGDANITFDSNIDSATKNLQIETDIIRSTTNIIDLEVSQDVNVDIINNVDFLGTINILRIEGLQNYLDYDYCYRLDCGGPQITGVCA